MAFTRERHIADFEFRFGPARAGASITRNQSIGDGSDLSGRGSHQQVAERFDHRRHRLIWRWLSAQANDLGRLCGLRALRRSAAHDAETFVSEPLEDGCGVSVRGFIHPLAHQQASADGAECCEILGGHFVQRGFPPDFSHGQH